MVQGLISFFPFSGSKVITMRSLKTTIGTFLLTALIPTPTLSQAPSLPIRPYAPGVWVTGTIDEPATKAEQESSSLTYHAFAQTRTIKPGALVASFTDDAVLCSVLYRGAIRGPVTSASFTMLCHEADTVMENLYLETLPLVPVGAKGIFNLTCPFFNDQYEETPQDQTLELLVSSIGADGRATITARTC